MPRDKEKQKEYNRLYNLKNKKVLLEKKLKRRKEQRDYIRKIKESPCFDCGQKFPYYVMDFDHINGKKKYNVSEFGRKSFSWKTIQEEIVKCVVVCSNCHRIRTFERNLVM